MKQKDAVFQAIESVMGSIEGNVGSTITSEQRKRVCMIVCEGFKAGKIDLATTYTDEELPGYVSGLVSNWIRKDTRLNGGSKYQAKNPGSRAGSGDETLKAIRAVKSTITPDDPRYADVLQAEQARLQELASAKTAKVIDFSKLPADLASKFSK